MKKLTKISVLLPTFFILMTVYGFAEFIEYHVKPLSAPVELFITGMAMVGAAQFIRYYYKK